MVAGSAACCQGCQGRGARPLPGGGWGGGHQLKGAEGHFAERVGELFRLSDTRDGASHLDQFHHHVYFVIPTYFTAKTYFNTSSQARQGMALLLYFGQ